ncbi:peptidase U32 [Clostridia bacterium]|nr:peptidase U32 [Clostridia bacterium]
MKKLEILAPAGSVRAVHAAVAAGADAVYFGGTRFSARANAANITDENLAEVIKYCRLRGVKCYVAVNTIYREDELPSVLAFMKFAFENGADAFILQDLGAARLCREFFPKIPMFASTQMAAHSVEDALFLRDAGFSRVILARELSLERIKEIVKTGIEVEVFAHGALCVSVSGRCLMSSALGGRSGNRGVCAQACRRQYVLRKGEAPVKRGYLLSTKDLCAVAVLPELLAAGVCAVKIEGRMKSPEYVYQAVKAYKTLVREDENKLAAIFNRGGFTDGYFKRHSGRDMINTKSPKNAGTLIGAVKNYDYVTRKCEISLSVHVSAGDGIELRGKNVSVGGGVNKNKAAGEFLTITLKEDLPIEAGFPVYKTFDKTLSDEINKGIDETERKIAVKGFCRAKIGEKLTIKLNYNGIEVSVSGDLVEKAQKNPLTNERLKELLEKTGGTPYFAEFTIEADEGIFAPVSKVNEVRREAFGVLGERIIAEGIPEKVDCAYAHAKRVEPSRNKKLIALVTTKEQLDAVLSVGGVYAVYAELALYKEIGEEFIKRCEAAKILPFVALPHFSEYNSGYENIPGGVLARTLGQLYALKDSGKELHADYTLNIANVKSFERINEYAEVCAVSTELSFESLNVFPQNAEIVVYGRETLMTTRQCPIGVYCADKGDGKHCERFNKHGDYSLKDGEGAVFPVTTDCDSCTAFILNSRPLFLANKVKDILNCPAGFLRLSFTVETGEQTREILSVYAEALAKKTERAADYAASLAESTGLTYGHFFKGI